MITDETTYSGMSQGRETSKSSGAGAVGHRSNRKPNTRIAQSRAARHDRGRLRVIMPGLAARPGSTHDGPLDGPLRKRTMSVHVALATRGHACALLGSAAPDPHGPGPLRQTEHWPVCLQATSLPRWIGVLERALAGCSQQELRKIFRDNANALYRLGLPQASAALTLTD
jgi:hypothetical protein